MVCFDAFNMQQKKVVVGSQRVGDSNGSDDSGSMSMMIAVAIFSGVGGIMLGVFLSYMYFSRYIYLGTVSKEIFAPKIERYDDDMEEALMHEELSSAASSRAPSRTSSITPFSH